MSLAIDLMQSVAILLLGVGQLWWSRRVRRLERAHAENRRPTTTQFYLSSHPAVSVDQNEIARLLKRWKDMS